MTHTLPADGFDANEDGTGRGTPIVSVQPLAVRGREGGAELEVAAEGAPYNALRAGDGGSSRSQLVAVTSLAVAGDFSSSENVAETVRAANGQPGVVAIDLRNATRESGTGVGTQGLGITEDGPSYGLSATERALPGVAYDTVVRRLTPLECERLQGFPDGWTESGADGPQSDSARYRQLGNSVAVPVVEWIAHGIVAIAESLGETA